MNRIEINVLTGEKTIIPLTEDEISEAVYRTSIEQAEKKRRDAITKLTEIDIASVRSIREYIAAQPDAPKALKDKETEAIAERVKLK